MVGGKCLVGLRGPRGLTILTQILFLAVNIIMINLIYMGVLDMC